MSFSRALGIVALIGASAPALAQTTSFVVIGDYGVDGPKQASVAARLATYNPSFITTVGDNNYIGSSFTSWDNTQGKYYAQWIKLPTVNGGSTANSSYLPIGTPTNGPDPKSNNFYPLLGNHDWGQGVTGYRNYFKNTPAGTSNYYSFVRGSGTATVEIFMLDSDANEPDGNTTASVQYQWLQAGLAASTAKFQVVMFHHPAWSYKGGGNHAPSTYMRWDFKDMGVDAVFSGHNHNMQAMDVSGLPYFVMGSSGRNLYYTPTDASGLPDSATGLFSNSTDYGFALVDVADTDLTVRFISETGTTLYTQVIPVPEPGWYLLLSAVVLAGFAAVRRYRSMSSATPASLCC